MEAPPKITQETQTPEKSPRNSETTKVTIEPTCKPVSPIPMVLGKKNPTANANAKIGRSWKPQPESSPLQPMLITKKPNSRLSRNPIYTCSF
jgi:hypothetical protein